MATDKQIAANRLNAQKCTGPRTPEGKAISSQNALKTGIDAKSEVIRCESRQEYENLIAEFYDRYNPTLPEERGLVDMMIRSEWLGRRYASVEAAVWERGFIEVGSESFARVLRQAGESFDRLDRRINSAQRNFQKAIKQLEDLRVKRAKEPADDQPIQIHDSEAVLPEPAPPESLSPALVSLVTEFQPTPNPTPETAGQPRETSETDPEKEIDPPIAA